MMMSPQSHLIWTILKSLVVTIKPAELRAALSTSKLPSSSGPDGIPVIALRINEFEDDMLDTIIQSSNMVDPEYNIPPQWKHSIIVSIPEKGYLLSLDK